MGGGGELVSRSLDNGLTWSEPRLLSRYAKLDSDSDADNLPILQSNGEGRWMCLWIGQPYRFWHKMRRAIFTYTPFNEARTWQVYK